MHHSIASFRWHVLGEGVDELHTTKMNCKNAVRRGVPFPDAWFMALRCSGLASIARESARKVYEQQVIYTQCCFLGQPRKSPLPRPSTSHAPGATVMLQTDGGARLAYLLCAHVREDCWYCHRGSFAGNTLDDDNPFDEKDLVMKDILRDAWEDGPPPKRQMRPQLSGGQLRNAARQRQAAWEQLLAAATLRALTKGAG